MKNIFVFLLSVFVLIFSSAKAENKKQGKTMTGSSEVSYLAGGCFWGMEELIRKLPGVQEVQVGYMGGTIKNATYNIVKTGSSQHAETVKVVFDPKKLKFEDLLLFFFKIHDPTTINRQGNDVGTQYRSVIFYTSEAQKEDAQRVINRVDKSKAWKNPVVTQVIKAEEFWKAEEEHQDYLQKHPSGYTCHYPRDIKF